MSFLIVASRRSRSLSRVLRRFGPVVYASGRQAIDHLKTTSPPLAVVVRCVSLDDACMEVIKLIRGLSPKLPLMVVTPSLSAPVSHELTVLDARYVLEPVSAKVVEHFALWALMANRSGAMRLDRAIGIQALRWGLTPRERQLVALVAKGSARRKSLSLELGVSDNTTKTLTRSVLSKTGTTRLSELRATLLQLPHVDPTVSHPEG